MEILDKHSVDFEELDAILKNKKIFSSFRLFKCILGLNKTESKVFTYLLNYRNVSTLELTKKLELDRSSIQRALQSLSRLNIIERKSHSMKDFTRYKGQKDSKKKGYVYVYNAKNIEAIKEQLKKLVHKWHESMLKYIENLDVFCDCCGIKCK